MPAHAALAWSDAGSASQLIAGVGLMGAEVRARRFFRWVWRANAILILMAAMFMVIGMSIALFQLYRDTAGRGSAATVVKVADEEIDRSKAALSGFQLVEGTGVFRASLGTDQEHGFGSRSGGERAVRNYLFHDPSDGSSRWLLPGNKGLFVATHELPEGGCGGRQGDEAEEASAGTHAGPEVPAHARAVSIGRGHRFAAYPRCPTDA